jgi:hypothetical protein
MVAIGKGVIEQDTGKKTLIGSPANASIYRDINSDKPYYQKQYYRQVKRGALDKIALPHSPQHKREGCGY